MRNRASLPQHAQRQMAHHFRVVVVLVGDARGAYVRVAGGLHFEHLKAASFAYPTYLRCSEVKIGKASYRTGPRVPCSVPYRNLPYRTEYDAVLRTVLTTPKAPKSVEFRKITSDTPRGLITESTMRRKWSKTGILDLKLGLHLMETVGKMSSKGRPSGAVRLLVRLPC